MHVNLGKIHLGANIVISIQKRWHPLDYHVCQSE